MVLGDEEGGGTPLNFFLGPEKINKVSASLHQLYFFGTICQHCYQMLNFLNQLAHWTTG